MTFSCGDNPEEVPNESPVISSVTFTPSSIEPQTTYVVTCNALDPENDPLTYYWRVSDGTENTTTDKQFEWTSPATGGQFQVEVRVEDNAGNSTASSISIVTQEVPETFEMFVNGFFMGSGSVALLTKESDFYLALRESLNDKEEISLLKVNKRSNTIFRKPLFRVSPFSYLNMIHLSDDNLLLTTGKQVVNLNPNGDILWSHDTSEARYVIEVNRTIWVFSQTDRGSTSSDINVKRISLDGSIISDWFFEKDGFDEVLSVTVTKDNRIIGLIREDSKERVFEFFEDQSRNLLFELDLMQRARITVTEDNDLIFSFPRNEIQNAGSTPVNMVISRLRLNGSLVWETTLSSNRKYLDHDLFYASDGNIYVTGRTDNETFISKISSSGTELWTSQFDGSAWNSDLNNGLSISETQDNKIVFAGSNVDASNNPRAFLRKLNSSGQF